MLEWRSAFACLGLAAKVNCWHYTWVLFPRVMCGWLLTLCMGAAWVG